MTCKCKGKCKSNSDTLSPAVLRRIANAAADYTRHVLSQPPSMSIAWPVEKMDVFLRPELPTVQEIEQVETEAATQTMHPDVRRKLNRLTYALKEYVRAYNTHELGHDAAAAAAKVKPRGPVPKPHCGNCVHDNAYDASTEKTACALRHERGGNTNRIFVECLGGDAYNPAYKFYRYDGSTGER